MDFDDFEDMLRDLWKIEGSFEVGQKLHRRLQAYQDAGRPFGRETEAFLIWVEFRQETTAN